VICCCASERFPVAVSRFLFAVSSASCVSCNLPWTAVICSFSFLIVAFACSIVAACCPFCSFRDSISLSLDATVCSRSDTFLFNAAIAALMASTFSSSVLLSRSPISSDPAISSSALSSFVSWSFIA